MIALLNHRFHSFPEAAVLFTSCNYDLMSGLRSIIKMSFEIVLNFSDESGKARFFYADGSLPASLATLFWLTWVPLVDCIPRTFLNWRISLRRFAWLLPRMSPNGCSRD